MATPEGAAPKQAAVSPRSFKTVLETAALEPNDRWGSGLAHARALAGAYDSFRNHNTISNDELARVIDLLTGTIGAVPADENGSPALADLLNWLGNALVELGNRDQNSERFATAVTAYTQALSIWAAAGNQPACLRLALNRGFALTKLAEGATSPEARDRAAAEAVEAISEVSSRLTRDAVEWERAHLLLGNALMAREVPGRAVEAAEAYEKAVTSRFRKSDPAGWAFVQDGHGTALLELGRYREAAEAWTAALEVSELAPVERGRILCNLGNARRRLGEESRDAVTLRLAAEAFDAASQLLPSSFRLWADAQYGLGQASRALGEQERAIQAFRLAAAAPARTLEERAGRLRALGVTLGEYAGVTRQYSLWDEAIEILAAATSLVSDKSDIADRLREDIRLAWKRIDSVSFGVDKKTAIARKFEAFLKRVGVEAPGLQASVSARVLPVIESAVGIDAPSVRAETKAPIEWPTETYSEAHRTRGENIVSFLERVWLPLIKAGQVDRRALRARDPSAEMAISNFTRGGRSLPKHVAIPRLKDLNDLALQLDVIPIKHADRLATARRRRRRQKVTNP